MVWSENLDEAPRDGSPVLLAVHGSPFLARWYEPWGVWHALDDPKPRDEDDYWGIGELIPTAWMPAPKVGSPTPFAKHNT